MLRVPDSTIHLDGALDEPAWASTFVMVLTQQDPHAGEPTAYHTEVRLLAASRKKLSSTRLPRKASR